jgi:hypothetical protein
LWNTILWSTPNNRIRPSQLYEELAGYI